MQQQQMPSHLQQMQQMQQMQQQMLPRDMSAPNMMMPSQPQPPQLRTEYKTVERFGKSFCAARVYTHTLVRPCLHVAFRGVLSETASLRSSFPHYPIPTPARRLPLFGFPFECPHRRPLRANVCAWACARLRVNVRVRAGAVSERSQKR